MGNTTLRRTLVPVLFAMVSLTGTWAQVKLANPGFAGVETLKYTETLGSVSRPFETTVAVAGEGSLSRIEYRTVGAEAESVFRLDPLSLVSLSSDTLTKAPDATVRRTADFRDLKIKAGPDDLAVTDFGSLPVVLRGFPWGQRTTAKVITVGSANFGGSGFSFEFTVVGKEKIVAAGKTWECWHATLGLGGAFAFVMGKSDLWFAVEGTHPLIKSSGPAGGPGSPMRVLVLQSVTVVR